MHLCYRTHVLPTFSISAKFPKDVIPILPLAYALPQPSKQKNKYILSILSFIKVPRIIEDTITVDLKCRTHKGHAIISQLCHVKLESRYICRTDLMLTDLNRFMSWCKVSAVVVVLFVIFVFFKAPQSPFSSVKCGWKGEGPLRPPAPRVSNPPEDTTLGKQLCYIGSMRKSILELGFSLKRKGCAFDHLDDASCHAIPLYLFSGHSSPLVEMTACLPSSGFGAGKFAGPWMGPPFFGTSFHRCLC